MTEGDFEGLLDGTAAFGACASCGVNHYLNKESLCADCSKNKKKRALPEAEPIFPPLF